jgi:uncharacterized HAD superfamily protein
MPKAIIVDIDGTLADVEHRVHHVRSNDKNWHAFNEGMSDDSLNFWCLDLICAMKNEETETLLVTGRGEEYRQHTEEWLKKHNVPYSKLFMRKARDHRGDDLIKREIYDTKIKDHYKILFVVDDRLSVVRMWREIGLVCLQCDWGDF